MPISMKLRVFLLNKENLQHFIHLISRENFLANAFTYNFELVKSVVFDINWISKAADLNKIEWRKLNSIQALLTLLKRTGERLKIYIYMAIANIADDKEIEEIEEIQSSIVTFVGFVNQNANEIISGHEQRTPTQFRDEDDENSQKSVIYNVCYCMDWVNNCTVSLTGSLMAIYRLSINPKLKWNIWTIVNFKESLKTILRLGNDIEKLYSIQVLGQLAFDEKILNDMKSDKKFVDLIKEIAEADSSVVQIEKLKKIAKQMAWSFQESKEQETKMMEPQKKEFKEDDSKHVMISYNTASRDLCLKIKEALEMDNHKVWIDVDEVNFLMREKNILYFYKK